MATGMREHTAHRIERDLHKIDIDWKTGEVLDRKTYIDPDGYAFVTLNGFPTFVAQMVLVKKYTAEKCIGMSADHVDKTRLNNSWDNIRLVSHKENSRNRRQVERIRSKVKSIHIKTGKEQIFNSPTEASKVLGVNRPTIHKVMSNDYKHSQTGGYYFERIEA